MHADQIAVGVAEVRALLAEQFGQFAGEDIVALRTAGTVNAIFRIGAGHAARFPLRMMDPLACKTLLEAEAEASTAFGRAAPFDAPMPVGIGKPGAGYPLPWLVQTWVEGEIATPTGLSGSPAFALDLARLIGALRAVDKGDRTFDGRGRGGHLPDHDGWMAECLAKSEGLLDVPRLRRMWAGFRALPAAARETMSHKDLIPANLLVRDGRLVGVLDGGGFGPADAALDLVAGWHLLDRERRGLLREALRADELEWQRGAAWAFQQAMGLVWYYKDSNPVMSALGRSTIDRLVEAEAG